MAHPEELSLPVALAFCRGSGRVVQKTQVYSQSTLWAIDIANKDGLVFRCYTTEPDRFPDPIPHTPRKE